MCLNLTCNTLPTKPSPDYSYICPPTCFFLSVRRLPGRRRSTSRRRRRCFFKAAADVKLVGTVSHDVMAIACTKVFRC